jgi:maltose O-acetyltransferase
VVIGPGAVIETGAVVMRGARVEAGAHVLAGAVVSRRVPAGAEFPPGSGTEAREPRQAAANAVKGARGPALGVAPSAVDVAVALLRAWILLRGCRKGVRIRARGYVRVIPTGRIALGDRITFLGGMVPTELVAHEGGELSIGSSTVVNYGSSFEAWNSIRIGCRCWIASFVRIADRGWQGTSPISVGDDVWIAHGATIEPGVTVGDGSVIAAGSVVTQDVPPNSLAMGNPARCLSLDLVAPAQRVDRVVGHG